MAKRKKSRCSIRCMQILRSDLLVYLFKRFYFVQDWLVTNWRSISSIFFIYDYYCVSLIVDLSLSQITTTLRIDANCAARRAAAADRPRKKSKSVFRFVSLFVIRCWFFFIVRLIKVGAKKKKIQAEMD